ncbi:oocyte zinc finger protein XlCOF6-like [Haliotis rubra]|uniref:oocyte zinc finger protein XlCOF6-like n=1 Tax=Haliotis rubra TaxID=36100 RepID=UPI001EE6092D|nr:oocyte zinc finger protein XlCOF6-like [Haliotis rubra]XP_046558278.1 oocyte zinc finger protein XlCOF6-like [Haliotis rubra]
MKKRKHAMMTKTHTARKRKLNVSPQTTPQEMTSLLLCTFIKMVVLNNELEVSLNVQSGSNSEVLRQLQDGITKSENVSTEIHSSETSCACVECGTSNIVKCKVLAFRIRVDEEVYKCSKCKDVTANQSQPCDGESEHCTSNTSTEDKNNEDIPIIEEVDPQRSVRQLKSSVPAETEAAVRVSESDNMNKEANASRKLRRRTRKQDAQFVGDVSEEESDMKEGHGDDSDNDASFHIKKHGLDEEETKQPGKRKRKPDVKLNHKSPHMCNICGKQLLNMKTLKSHMTTHSTGDGHTCKICNRKFSHIRYLKKHEKTHTKDKPYSCEICGQRFKLKESVPKHMVLHGGVKPHKCDLCHKEFHLQEQMKKHRQIHTDERKFICELCGKRFRTQGSMKSHKDTHEGPQKHSCDQCGKSYRSAWYLKIHRKTHTGENLIQCHTCGDWFIDPCYFKLHQKKFCKGKPLSCSLCELEFPHNQALQSHMGLHTGERPFGCKICGKAFAKAPLLAEHTKRHTLENCHTCQYCKKGFINNKELKRHEKCHVNKKKKASLPERLKPGRIDHEPQVVQVLDQVQHLDQVAVEVETTDQLAVCQFPPNTAHLQVVSTPSDIAVPGPGETCNRYNHNSIVDHGSASTYTITSVTPDIDTSGASTQVLDSRGGHITIHDSIPISHVYTSPPPATVHFTSPPSFSMPRPPPPAASIVSTPEGEQLQQLHPIATTADVNMAYENEASVQHLLQAAAIIKNYPSHY